MAFTDITGQRFGRLVAVEQARIGGRLLWRCRCDCGRNANVQLSKLRRGHTTSCGCYRAERNRLGPKTHGQSETRLHEIWMAMRKRCRLSTASNFHNYGGRGIRVCVEWEEFASFRDWASGAGYQDGLSIDRIDNDGNYEPGNCRWVPKAIQARNTRRTVTVTADGITACVKDHAARAGVSYWALIKLIRRGYPPQAALDRLRNS